MRALGATGMAGTLAIQNALLLGASRVVGAGRAADKLARATALGLSQAVQLTGDVVADGKALADALGGACDHLLGAATAIHLGGVDQGHAELDAEPQRRRLVGSTAPVLTHVPGPLAERRQPLAVAQRHMPQLFGNLSSPELCS